MQFILQTLLILMEILTLLIFINVILSWLVRDRKHPIVRSVRNMIEPILHPIRRSIPRFGPLDISPLVALLIIQLIRQLILSV